MLFNARRDMSKAVSCIIPIINTACVSYGFPRLKMWLRSFVFLFFVNFSISQLCYATQLGNSLTTGICASNGDTGGVYSGHLATF